MYWCSIPGSWFVHPVEQSFLCQSLGQHNVPSHNISLNSDRRSGADDWLSWLFRSMYREQMLFVYGKFYFLLPCEGNLASRL